MLKEP